MHLFIHLFLFLIFQCCYPLLVLSCRSLVYHLFWFSLVRLFSPFSSSPPPWLVPFLRFRWPLLFIGMSDMDADNDVEMKTDANLTTELHSKPQLFPGEQPY